MEEVIRDRKKITNSFKDFIVYGFKDFILQITIFTDEKGSVIINNYSLIYKLRHIEFGSKL